jgi:hypothetical protein
MCRLACHSEGPVLNVGVLIVGSLAWDERSVRVGWRADRLALGDRRRVTAPIRYGRLSESREATYTMVFTAPPHGRGVALAVPCVREARTGADLVEEAEALWRAEAADPSLEAGTVSAPWGCVAALANPNSQEAPDVLAEWAECVTGSPGYGRLPRAADEAPFVDARTGTARMSWPAPVDGDGDLKLDVLLMTATAPHIVDGRYPEAQVVADAWMRRLHRLEYFTSNRAWGIETQMDGSILARLESGMADAAEASQRPGGALQGTSPS